MKRMNWKRIAIIFVIAVFAVFSFAISVFAGEPSPSIAENVEAAFTGAGAQLTEVVTTIATLAVPVMIAVAAFMIAKRIFKSVAK